MSHEKGPDTFSFPLTDPSGFDDLQLGAVTKGMPISITISDITLKVISDNDPAKVLKTIDDLKHGNLAFPIKIPGDQGYDLTKFRGDTAKAQITVTIANNGNKDLTFNSLLYFGSKLVGPVPDELTGYDNKDAHVIRINAGKTQTFILRRSQDIQGVGAAINGRYSFYSVLSIFGNGLNGNGFTVVTTVTKRGMSENKMPNK